MSAIITILHIAVCLALIVIILLQAGKGAGMGAAFGGSSQTLFGSTGRATFLTKITIAAAIIFGFTCLGLSFMENTEGGLMDQYEPERTEPAPGVGLPAAGIPVPATEPTPGPGTQPAAEGLDLPDLNPAPVTGTPETPAPVTGTPETPAPEPESAMPEGESTP